MSQMRTRLKCRLHWRRINEEILTVPRVIQVMETKKLELLFTLFFFFIEQKNVQIFVFNVVDRCISIAFYKIFDRRVLKKENFTMETRK